MTLQEEAQAGIERARNMKRERAAKRRESSGEAIAIKAPTINYVAIGIRGTAPYVTNKFSEEMKAKMRAQQEEGRTSKSRKTRDPKDFDEKAKQTMHVSTAGWVGIPASAIRSGMIDACRLVGYKMTMAKMSVFVKPDGFDKDDGTALVKFTKGKPHQCEHYVRLANGSADIASRMMFDAGWEAKVTIGYDAEQFRVEDVTNLLARVGIQVGIGAGRPFSKESGGMGWGVFEVITD